MMSRVVWKLYLAGSLSLVLMAAGCGILPDEGQSCPASEAVTRGLKGKPRVRFGCYPSANLGTVFQGPGLGSHGYRFRLSEKNGIAYTCRGGHIDVIHARISADWTAHLAARTYQTLMKHETGFAYKLAVDRSRNLVTFSYPQNWDRLSEAERAGIAKEVALTVGPYLAYTTTTWHEILTWFGFKCIGLATEFPSAFSWEDSYSNLLGTIIATRALRDSQHRYNEAMTIALAEEMQRLGVQPARVARQASESVRGKWFTGHVLFFVELSERNLDIGIDDGYITPTLVPGVAVCPDAEPVPLPVPTLDALSRHGFSAKLEIEPHEWERGKILRVVYGDKPQKRVVPAEHFGIIMDEIRRQAAAMYGPR
jgi:hypothetical protein